MIKIEDYIRDFNFVKRPDQYQKRISREVYIGDIPLGGNNPIRIQSMTTTNTLDIEATVAQSIRMIDAGCEYVRITAPSQREAEALREIRKKLTAAGYTTPLVADIHFTPKAAEIAARYVEKVRVNPGNYADKKKFEVLEYSDAQYEVEIERIRERFVPLVKVCKEYGRALRIGTNHGSLSDRIMSRFGDTPVGMVESAMEFLRICEDENYNDIVLSMKASNPIVMVQAYRLLVAKMNQEGMNYPLHLGVTEAGEGEDGRIKSAMGIGTLLEDGLGDTIRVSLTEEPEYEVPVAISLAQRYEMRTRHFVSGFIPADADYNALRSFYNPYETWKRQTDEVENIGDSNVPRVIMDLSSIQQINELSLKAIDYHYDPVNDKWNMGDMGCDYIYVGSRSLGFMPPSGLKVICEYPAWREMDHQNAFPIFDLQQFLAADVRSEKLNFIRLTGTELNRAKLQAVSELAPAVFILESKKEESYLEQRKFFIDLQRSGSTTPVVIKCSYLPIDAEQLQLNAATDAGGLLIDGFGNGIWLQQRSEGLSDAQHREQIRMLNRASFTILQASRTRISKTEYISCPSCGRTLFDLQETTAMIRRKTDHLKGVKIAIMGCIVNGPGEMADADYGYVGTGPGKITLYRGKEVVKRNIGSANALNELIELIKADGNWLEQHQQSPVQQE
ncbi:MAG: (E)-4-hydroxy-3-methylbut-2-enyl-diphosphate synthase [Bacteroidia bacterium]